MIFTRKGAFCGDYLLKLFLLKLCDFVKRRLYFKYKTPNKNEYYYESLSKQTFDSVCYRPAIHRVVTDAPEF
jgi:hypothetical protein